MPKMVAIAIAIGAALALGLAIGAAAVYCAIDAEEARGIMDGQ